MTYQLWVSPETGYRRKGTRFSELKKIFVDDVTAKSIYEPLHSCPNDWIAELAKVTLKKKGFDVAGVKKNKTGEVIGYIIADELKCGDLSKYVNPITPNLLISDSIPIADIFTTMMDRDFSFVLVGKQISGIVTKADINKPPVRIYLFGMISLFEMHLTRWIDHFNPHNSWENKISDDRLKKAQDIYQDRRRKNQDLTLIECLQICDKRDILLNTDGFNNDFELSKNWFYKFVKQIQILRDNLAHSQKSIISNIHWSDFVETISNLERFLINSDLQVEKIAIEGIDTED